MYQMRVCVDKNRKKWLSLLEKSLVEEVRSGGIVTAYYENNDRCELYFAGNGKVGALKRKIKAKIIKLITSAVKEEYIRKRIDSYSSNAYLMGVYVRVLKEFNKVEEERFLQESLKIYDSFALDGFYMFAMKRLKDMWNDLVLLSEDNCDLIKDESSFRLLLKYMLSCLPSKSEEISIDYKKGKYELESQGKRFTIKTTDEVIYMLIELAPLKISLTQNAGKTDLNEMIFGIFDAKKV